MNVKTYSMLNSSDIDRSTFSTRQEIFEEIPLPITVLSVNSYTRNTYKYMFDIQAIYIYNVWVSGDIKSKISGK